MGIEIRVIDLEPQRHTFCEVSVGEAFEHACAKFWKCDSKQAVRLASDGISAPIRFDGDMAVQAIYTMSIVLTRVR